MQGVNPSLYDKRQLPLSCRGRNGGGNDEANGWKRPRCINTSLASELAYIWAKYNDQPAEITLNGGLVRESPQSPLN